MSNREIFALEELTVYSIVFVTVCHHFVTLFTLLVACFAHRSKDLICFLLCAYHLLCYRHREIFR